MLQFHRTHFQIHYFSFLTITAPQIATEIIIQNFIFSPTLGIMRHTGNPPLGNSLLSSIITHLLDNLFLFQCKCVMQSVPQAVDHLSIKWDIPSSSSFFNLHPIFWRNAKDILVDKVVTFQCKCVMQSLSQTVDHLSIKGDTGVAPPLLLQQWVPLCSKIL